MYDSVVIGAGVVGAMVARLLSQHEGKVCILEKEYDIAMGATKANSAIVHAGFDAKFGSLKAKLNVRGSEMMQQVCRELDVHYIKNGSIVIGYSDEDKAKLQELLENGQKNGVKDLEIVEGEKLRALEPNLADEVTCALVAPTGAIVCPYELTEAGIGNAMDNGAELKCNFEVASIEKKGDVFEITSTNGDKVTSKVVINAAGLYSDKVAEMIGENDFDVHPRAGEYMLLDKEWGDYVSHTVFTVPSKMGKGILVSPTVDGNLILGPTATDIEDKTAKQTTRAGLNSVSENVKRMVKGVDLRAVITSFCGLRAVGSTGDFIIDMPQKGFVNAAGIESPGLSAAPAIAEYILSLLQENGFNYTKKTDYIKERKSFRNFRFWDIERKNEMIKKDPAFGTIICRCEGISEGEIRHAIHANPKPRDLDGVKRRTRSQMGRCQGGFCSPYIMKILAQELSVDMEKITKCGGGSYVLSKKIKEEGTNA